MNEKNRGDFTLSDIRAIRYLVLALGVVGAGMLLITDPDSPLMVAGFIGLVTLVPLGTIFCLRRLARRRARRGEAPRQEGLP